MVPEPLKLAVATNAGFATRSDEIANEARVLLEVVFVLVEPTARPG